jgi:hypothetical protein
VPRASTGTVRLIGGAWHAKWTRSDGSRSPWTPLPGAIALEDEAGAARLAPRIRAAGVTGSAVETVETVETGAGRWLDDRTARVNSIRADRSRVRDHVLPELGKLDVRNRRNPSEVKGTKSDAPRRFAVEPNLLPLLKVMRSEERPLGANLPSERAMARNLRRWLWKAGVRRPALHEESPTAQHITWHDLRATGATWMAVRGDDAHKIMQRCGHKSFSTTMLYVGEGEAIREGFGDPFPSLPECLLGIAPNRPGGDSALTFEPKTSTSERGGRDSNASCERGHFHGETRGIVDPRRLTSRSNPQTPRSTPGLAGASADLAAPKAEPTDADLEAAIVRAVLG